MKKHKIQDPKMLILQAFTTVIIIGTISGKRCSHSSWKASFDEKGLSRCNEGNFYIQGFKRSATPVDWVDGLYLLEGVDCCSLTPQRQISEQIKMQYDWTGLMIEEENWANCPQGYFLQGLYRSDKCHRKNVKEDYYTVGSSRYTSGLVDCPDGFLQNIEDGTCGKPVGYPDKYSECYIEDISACFNKSATCSCKRDDYFVAGIYKGRCDELSCLEKLRCCRLADKPEQPDSCDRVKAQMIEKTLIPMSYLANMLGYGWCAGCKGLYVGEDFRRIEEDTWVADKTARCDGFKSNHRLNIKFDNWRFEVKEIIYGKIVEDYLPPTTADQGIARNEGSIVSNDEYTRKIIVQNSVTQTSTSAWKKGHTLGISIDLSILGIIGSSRSYSFNYEESNAKGTEIGNQTVKEFNVKISRPLPANSYTEWRVLVKRSRKTLPYTAIVAAKFSAEFQGFLRWGGAYKSSTTNYHKSFRGSGKRPTINYPFGNDSVPFYTALKHQSESLSEPWLWMAMQTAYPSSENVINRLIDENQYLFKLNGKIEVNEGYSTDVVWGKIKNITASESRLKRSLKNDNGGKTVFMMKNSNDKPAQVNYPEIELNKMDNYDLKPIPLDKFDN
ncbi:hypothetical protein Btru_058742 [Bulinus truncatus]|nr:hypothetical protein Btru_058742 [Bulinus truncatus]